MNIISGHGFSEQEVSPHSGSFHTGSIDVEIHSRLVTSGLSKFCAFLWP